MEEQNQGKPKPQHSPAPWKFVSEPDGYWVIDDAQGFPLMGNEEIFGEISPWVPKNEADWHLIKAAPDLLASLREMLAFIDLPHLTELSNDTIERARAAVKRAAGAA